MIDLYKDLKKQWNWRAGYKYADSVLSEWLEGPLSDDEMRSAMTLRLQQRSKNADDAFGAGFCVRWQECGANDASLGRIRAKKFRSHWYNMGWWNRMIEQHEAGWHHSSLDSSFKKMGTLYWERIGTDGSNEFYNGDQKV